MQFILFMVEKSNKKEKTKPSLLSHVAYIVLNTH